MPAGYNPVTSIAAALMKILKKNRSICFTGCKGTFLSLIGNSRPVIYYNSDFLIAAAFSIHSSYSFAASLLKVMPPPTW